MTKKNIYFILLLVIISIFAFLPHKSIPHAIDTFNANYKHVLAFFSISFYMYFYKKSTLIEIFIFILLFGIYIEVIQGLYTTREFSLYDLFFDLIGYLLLTALVFHKLYFSKIYYYLIIKNKENICQIKK